LAFVFELPAEVEYACASRAFDIAVSTSSSSSEVVLAIKNILFQWPNVRVTPEQKDSNRTSKNLKKRKRNGSISKKIGGGKTIGGKTARRARQIRKRKRAQRKKRRRRLNKRNPIVKKAAEMPPFSFYEQHIQRDISKVEDVGGP
jgi:hypothetical protein